jgi:hypothetical protein
MCNVGRARDATRQDIGGVGWTYPASGGDGTGGINLPPMGARFRLKSDDRLLAENRIDLRPGPPNGPNPRPYTAGQIKFLRALQTYGFIVCDSAYTVDYLIRGTVDMSGIFDARWSSVGPKEDTIHLTDTNQLQREWFLIFRADSSTGVPAPANAIDINCFEMLVLGAWAYDPNTKTITLHDPHP